MIKTVSFAPPRPSGPRSGAKPTGAKTVPVQDLRPATRPASGRTSKAAKAPAQTSLEFSFDAPDEPAVEPVEAAPVAVVPEPKAVKKAAKTVKAAPVAAPIEVAAPETVAVEAPAIEAPAIEAPKAEAKPAKTKEVRAKKSRVPADLAAQYGEKVVERVVAPPVEAEIVKKRLNKIERQARRDLIKPSDDLMARLARLNQIGARKPKAEPRGKGWKFQCGRCGTTSYFETPGGLCACGAIAIKE